MLLKVLQRTGQPLTTKSGSAKAARGTQHKTTDPGSRVHSLAEGTPSSCPASGACSFWRLPCQLCQFKTLHLGFVSSPPAPPKRAHQEGACGDFRCKPFLSIVKNLHLSLWTEGRSTRPWPRPVCLWSLPPLETSWNVREIAHIPRGA